MGKQTDENLKRKLYEKQLGIQRNVRFEDVAASRCAHTQVAGHSHCNAPVLCRLSQHPHAKNLHADGRGGRG